MLARYISREHEQLRQWQPPTTSVPGLRLACGSLLVMMFGRMQEHSADAMIAFTGLDPRPNDSGKKSGSRRLSKRGWSKIRRLLYVAAMSAARTKTWNEFYRAQRDKGLSTTAALIVLARKLLRVAFALFKQKSHFDGSMMAVKA